MPQAPEQAKEIEKFGEVVPEYVSGGAMCSHSRVHMPCTPHSIFVHRMILCLWLFTLSVCECVLAGSFAIVQHGKRLEESADGVG